MSELMQARVWDFSAPWEDEDRSQLTAGMRSQVRSQLVPGYCCHRLPRDKMQNVKSAFNHFPPAGGYVSRCLSPIGVHLWTGVGVSDLLVLEIRDPWAGGVSAKVLPELGAFSHHCPWV